MATIKCRNSFAFDLPATDISILAPCASKSRIAILSPKHYNNSIYQSGKEKPYEKNDHCQYL